MKKAITSMKDDFFTLLQINDAAFPIGSYTLSWGLETFVQQGLVSDGKSAEKYFQSELEANFLTNELLPVRLSFEAAQDKDFKRVFEIDEIYNASKNAREIREGSKKLALRFYKTLSLWEKNEEKLSFLKKIQHFPLIYGAYCGLCQTGEMQALESFIYSQLSARIVNGVKLVPLSQMEGQKILHSLFPRFNSLLEKVMTLNEEDLCLSAPSGEIRGMEHEYLYTRLYMS